MVLVVFINWIAYILCKNIRYQIINYWVYTYCYHMIEMYFVNALMII